jgi:hypothetical protein
MRLVADRARSRSGGLAAAAGCLLFAAACAVPGIGLFRGQLGTSLFQSYGDSVLAGKVPYRDFSLEYPPGALPAFVVPSLGPAGEYSTWFSAFEVACGLAVVVSVAWALSALGARPARLLAGVSFAALAPLALGPLTLHRYDLFATALATAGLAALLAGHGRLALALLAAGTAAKVFPVVLVPLALLQLGRRRAWTALGWFAGVLLAIVVPFTVLGAGGVRFSLERQTGRALQIETIGSSGLLVLHAFGAYAPRVVFGSGSWNLAGTLPDALAGLLTAMQVAAVVSVWILYARGPRTRERLVLAAAAAVSAWVVFGKVLSPQFLLWLVPLVALLPARRYAFVLVSALGLTQAVYPARYDELVELQALPVALLAARSVLLVFLVGSLLRELHRQGVSQEVRGESQRGEAGDAVFLDGRERDRPDGIPRLEP